jgi:hypothetical protein
MAGLSNEKYAFDNGLPGPADYKAKKIVPKIPGGGV